VSEYGNESNQYGHPNIRTMTGMYNGQPDNSCQEDSRGNLDSDTFAAYSGCCRIANRGNLFRRCCAPEATTSAPRTSAPTTRCTPGTISLFETDQEVPGHTALDSNGDAVAVSQADHCCGGEDYCCGSGGQCGAGSDDCGKRFRCNGGTTPPTSTPTAAPGTSAPTPPPSDAQQTQYIVGTDRNVNYDAATRWCENQGYEIAMPKTVEDNNRAYAACTTGQASQVRRCFLGLELRRGVGWFWADGMAVTWSNWVSGQGTDLNTEETRGFYWDSPGWHDVGLAGHESPALF